MASFLAKHGNTTNPDSLLYQQVDTMFKATYPEDYKVYNAMNMYKINLVKLMKQGKTLKQAEKILDDQNKPEA